MRVLRSSFSLKEAAVIAVIPERYIRHEIEIGAVRPKTKRVGKVAHFVLTDCDIYYFVVVNKLDFDLKLRDRRNLCVAIVRKLKARGRWKVDRNSLVLDSRIPTRLETGETFRNLATRVRAYAPWARPCTHQT